ncbi:MAG: T9SS type A sorting domain-containing protein, partial [Gemmatimonadota bacterium]|nr:T9SS type A sorting domain-containing protein [Gemmatimonadota bacterium]
SYADMADPGAALARAAARCTQVQPYTLGTAVPGEFTTSDCQAMNGQEREPVDHYRVETDGQRDVHVVVEAPGMDVSLKLLREDGVELKSGGYTGAFTSLSTQVPAGTYRLVLRSEGAEWMNSRPHGRYTLRSSTDQVGFEGCPPLQPVQLGSAVQGEWSVTDCTSPQFHATNLQRFDAYLLTLPAQRDVVLTLASPGIKSSINLFTRDGAPVAQASAYGSEGRITTQLAPGAYVVRVGVSGMAGPSDRQTGRYTLQVR